MEEIPMKSRNKPAQRIRREKALARLRIQLEAGTKTESPIAMITLATTGAHLLPLTDGDRQRIRKEISILETSLSIT